MRLWERKKWNSEISALDICACETRCLRRPALTATLPSIHRLRLVPRLFDLFWISSGCFWLLLKGNRFLLICTDFYGTALFLQISEVDALHFKKFCARSYICCLNVNFGNYDWAIFGLDYFWIGLDWIIFMYFLLFRGSLAVFNVLCEKYKTSLSRDPAYLDVSVRHKITLSLKIVDKMNNYN